MYSVIIVEDEQNILDGIVKLVDFDTYGFVISGTAKNGRDALKLIETNKPHLVITDIKMPVMDGITLLENINKKFPFIKTIVLTGYDDFKYIKRVINLGAVGYISKLTMFDEIGDILKRVFEEISLLESIKFLRKLQLRNNIVSQFLYYSQGHKQTGHSNNIPRGKWIASTVIQLNTESRLIVPDDINKAIQIIEPLEVENEVISVQLKNDLFALVFFLDSKNDILVQKHIDILISSFKSFHDSISLFIGISNWYSDPDCCGKSIAEAQIAIANRKFLPGEIVVHSKNLQYNDMDDDTSLNQLLSSTINAVDSRDYKYINHEILKSVSEFLSSSKIFDKTRKNLFTFLSVLIWKLESISKNTRIFEPIKSEILDLNNISEPVEFKRKLIDIVLQAIEPLRELNKADNEYIIQMICNFIDTHLYENITLSQMSTFSYITQSYLSILFKKYTGTTFSEYVNNKKMLKSYELLKAGHPVSYVSRIIGYSETKNFRHMFKKHYGINPAEIKHG